MHILKQVLIRAVITAVLVAPICCSAELLFYKGVERENIVGESHGLRFNAKSIIIIDRTSTNFARISYVSIRGIKRYVSSQFTNAHFVPIIGANEKTFTAITRIPSECQAQENPGHESIYLKGPDVLLKVGDGSTLPFPKILTGIGAGVSFAPGSNEPSMLEQSFLVSFNQAETNASHATNETLTAAVARVVGLLESQGYTQ